MSSYLATILRLTPSTLFASYSPLQLGQWRLALFLRHSVAILTLVWRMLSLPILKIYRILLRTASQWERSRRWLGGRYVLNRIWDVSCESLGRIK